MAAKKRKSAKRAAPKRTKPPAGGRGKLRERALGPAADEFGQEIAPVGKEAGVVAVKVGRLLLGMVDGTVYGIEQVGTWLRDAVTKRLAVVSVKRITKPNPRIAVPAVQALVYSMHDEVVREMYANLLAADMNQDMKASAHPAFVDLIKEMTSREAKILRYLERKPHYEYRVHHPQQDKWVDLAEFVQKGVEGTIEECAIGLSNLQRLGLIEVNGLQKIDRAGKGITKLWWTFGSMPADSKKNWILDFDGARNNIVDAIFGVHLTPMGERFLRVCLPRD
jgi:hypothetical protein